MILRSKVYCAILYINSYGKICLSKERGVCMKQGVHLSKFKRGDAGGIEAEQKREYDDLSKYRNDVNHDLTMYNTVQNYLSNESWSKIITSRIKIHEEKTGRKIRKDAVVFGSFVESVPSSWSRELAQKYFDMQRDVKVKLLKKYGIDDDCLLSHICHYDEGSPHCTDTFMPIKDGKFNFKKLCTQAFYKELGKVTWDAYLSFELMNVVPESLEEPEWGNGRKHKDDLQFKIDSLEKEVASLRNERNELRNERDELRDEIKGMNTKFLEQQKLYNDNVQILKEQKDVIQHWGVELETIKDEKEYVQEADNVVSSLGHVRELLERLVNRSSPFRDKTLEKSIMSSFGGLWTALKESLRRMRLFEVRTRMKEDERLSPPLVESMQGIRARIEKAVKQHNEHSTLAKDVKKRSQKER